MAAGIPTADVIRVLKAHKVNVSLVDKATQTYMFERGDFIEQAILTEVVGKRYLQYLKRKLDIPIHHFWNPEDAENR